MRDTHAQMREMARDLIRDSVIEDAIAQRIAQIIEFIHEDRIKPLEAKLAKAVQALEGCMIGGNHLVTWLPENHLPADTDPLAALVRHGAGVSHDIWCCWRSIMQARSALAELKGDKP